MLSQLEHAKLASRITSEALDQKRMQQCIHIDDGAAFWSDVKQLVLTTRAFPRVLLASDVLNTNIASLHHACGLTKEVYDVFLNTSNPIAVPVLLDTRAADQAVSYELFEPLLTAYDRKTEHPLWVHNNILCAQISLNKQWTSRNINSLHHMVMTLSCLNDMWKEAYSHLPEEQLFICPDRLSQFSDSVLSVFPIVHNRCPQNLGKLMNAALTDCFAIRRGWVAERYLEEWSDLWAGLSFEHWQHVKIPDNEYMREVLQPYQQMAHQKHNIKNAVQAIAAPMSDTKRKM